jgi:phospholipid transport system substrate-binding protein
MMHFPYKQSLQYGQFILCCLVCGMLMNPYGVAAGSTGPAEMLSEMTAQVLLEIRSNPAILSDEQRARELAERQILPNIDFHTASRWVLGKHWRSASHAQRNAFVSEFRELLISTYLRSLDKYHDNVIKILPARPGQPDGRAIVDAEVEQVGGPEVKVMFRLHRKADNWLVYDIVIEGISLVATHRSGFATEIRDRGLDSLIARLVLQNASEATAAGVSAQ